MTAFPPSGFSLIPLGTNFAGHVTVEPRGPDPLNTQLDAIQYGEAGTAVAGIWGPHYFFGTAKHVLEGAEIKDLTFARNVGELKKQAASDVKMENAFEPISLNDQTAVIHRCEWDDLAVITTTPNVLGNFLEFFDIADFWIDPTEKDPLVGIGYPISASLIFQKERTSNPIEKAIVLSPTPFSGAVLPSTRGKFFKNFDSERHFLMDYDPAKEGQHPRGISGAAVWMRKEERRHVWTVTLEFAGICTHCYIDGNIEKIIKASAVRQFLTEIFGVLQEIQKT